MKIYVIEDGEYSDYHIVGVYSSRENAEFIREKLGCGEIAEWELDAGVENLRAGMSIYQVWMRRDGDTELVCRQTLSDSGYSYQRVGHSGIWKRSEAPAYKGQNLPDLLDATIWAKDEKGAIKRANEIRTQMIAKGEW